MKVTLPRLNPNQEEVRQSGARFKVLPWGRRSGKTHFCSALAAETALNGGLAWWVAPTYDVARIGWRLIANIANQIPGTRILKADREIIFPGGGWAAIRSADGHRSLRGEGIDRLIIDDAAFVKESVWIADLRPALSDKQGGAVFISTPNGRGWFHSLYKRGNDPTWPDWESWQFPTSSNPLISADEIATAKRELPEWLFRQEYLAEFVTFAGRVYKTFDPVGRHVFTDPPGEYDAYYGGLDFGFRNPMVATVFGEKDGGLDGVNEVYERGLTPDRVISCVLELQEKYNVEAWWADPSDPAMILALQEAGVPVDPAPRAKGGLEESWVKNGIVEVEKLLCADPPLLRFYRAGCPCTIQDFDRYRYPEQKEGAQEKERPLKVDDHGCDSTRYAVVGWVQMRSMSSEVIVL